MHLKISIIWDRYAKHLFIKASQMEGFAMVHSSLYTISAKCLDHWLENHGISEFG